MLERLVAAAHSNTGGCLAQNMQPYLKILTTADAVLVRGTLHREPRGNPQTTAPSSAEEPLFHCGRVRADVKHLKSYRNESRLRCY